MLRKHGKGKTIALNMNGRYHFHTRYADGVERIEEWWIPGERTTTNRRVIGSSSCSASPDLELSKISLDPVLQQEYQIISRKWKNSSNKSLRKELNENVWEYEIGSEETIISTYPKPAMKQQDDTRSYSENNQVVFSKSSTNPSFHAEESKLNFIFKVRNCPWPIKTYILEVDDNGKLVVLKTTNKKYYKRFPIPAMSRLNERLTKESFKMKHDEGKSELTISYEKPRAVLDDDIKEIKLRMEALRKIETNDIDMNSCRQS